MIVGRITSGRLRRLLACSLPYVSHNKTLALVQQVYDMDPKTRKSFFNEVALLKVRQHTRYYVHDPSRAAPLSLVQDCARVHAPLCLAPSLSRSL